MRVLDGPAQDAELSLRACPTFLRVTIGPRGRVDALDQADDVPSADEVVWAYRIVEGTWGQVFACVRGRGGGGGHYEYGDYRLINPQPDVEVLLDRARWIEWVTQTAEREGTS